MLEELKKQVCCANIELSKKQLVISTWGNVSAIDRQKNLVVIKPSGVSYENMSFEDMVVVDLDGNIIEGKLKPSTDLQTHLVLYKNFKKINSIVHTHSFYATAFAQAGKKIPCFGTTHADYFNGDIPCTKKLSSKKIINNYESNTGLEIIKTFKNLSYCDIPACLVKEHGVFVWGNSALETVETAYFLETISKMAYLTLNIKQRKMKIRKILVNKHFYRKHGSNSYYGQ